MDLTKQAGVSASVWRAGPREIPRQSSGRLGTNSSPSVRRLGLYGNGVQFFLLPPPLFLDKGFSGCEVRRLPRVSDRVAHVVATRVRAGLCHTGLPSTHTTCTRGNLAATSGCPPQAALGRNRGKRRPCREEQRTRFGGVRVSSGAPEPSDGSALMRTRGSGSGRKFAATGHVRGVAILARWGRSPKESTPTQVLKKPIR